MLESYITLSHGRTMNSAFLCCLHKPLWDCGLIIPLLSEQLIIILIDTSTCSWQDPKRLQHPENVQKHLCILQVLLRRLSHSGQCVAPPWLLQVQLDNCQTSRGAANSCIAGTLWWRCARTAWIISECVPDIGVGCWDSVPDFQMNKFRSLFFFFLNLIGPGGHNFENVLVVGGHLHSTAEIPLSVVLNTQMFALWWSQDCPRSRPGSGNGSDFK